VISDPANRFGTLLFGTFITVALVLAALAV
jgi:hypothetical protein